MKVYIYGNGQEAETLKNKVQLIIEELGLIDFIKTESSNDDKLKQELGITAESALVIEEESIDFKDMIFEGMIPSDDEIKSMFVSIIGGGSTGGCAPGGCSSGDCSC